MNPSLRLTTSPIWQQVENTRTKTSTFLKSHGLPADTVNALSMVVGELVENSIKYGKFHGTKDKVTVDVYVDSHMVTIEVSNPVDRMSHHHLKRLDKMIQWIRGHQDPFEAYIRRLKDVSKKPLDDEESGLGLARITYESKAIVDFFIGEDEMLNVSAVAQLK